MIDKAGNTYWSQVWVTRALPSVIDPASLGLSNYVNRCFHRYFAEVFAGLEAHRLTLLEIGCAQSAWLPYFVREFGFRACGLDYSEIGCQQARQVLSQAGVEGDIVCADLFTPPASMLESIDVVVSIGVVEHFSDTAACLAAFAKLLKPGGIVVTIVPNMVGAVGSLQKMLNRPVFDIHVPLDKEALMTAHRNAGLDVRSCHYFLSTSFGVCNLNGLPSGTISWRAKRLVLAGLSRLSMGAWWIEEQFGVTRTSRLFSPYIICLARKQSGGL